MISGNMVGSYSQLGKTFIIEDENGSQFTGVVTDKEVIFTANAATDIREGTIAATDEGIVTGTKRIPSYETTQEAWLVFPGESFSVPLDTYDKYNYTKFQCVITKFETSVEDSVFTDRVSLNNCVYAVNSTEVLSNITKNSDTKSIDLNIINDTENTYVVQYFTYKEEL